MKFSENLVKIWSKFGQFFSKFPFFEKMSEKAFQNPDLGVRKGVDLVKKSPITPFRQISGFLEPFCEALGHQIPYFSSFCTFFTDLAKLGDFRGWSRWVGPEGFGSRSGRSLLRIGSNTGCAPSRAPP